ncbi:MAG: ABC transporter substrate-binding protein [Anaerolineae bacterium]|nr:ABC transporter substrate-binding protein [Anaerolineae bacterium]
MTLNRLPILFIFLVLFLTACGGAAPEAGGVASEEAAANQAEASDPIILRVGAPDDDYRLDPQDPGRTNVAMAQVNTNVFDRLTQMDVDFQIQPMLAESWEYMPDSGTWRFKLRQDVTFHNGEPFTAEAVVEMIKRVAPGGFATILKIDENSAVAVDDYTVDITPTTENVQLPGQIAHPNFGIRAPGSDPFAGENIGTGPFMFKEYVEDDHITVVKNPDYWGEVAQVDEIEFRFMPDPNTRVLALQAGEVDLIYDVPRESAGLLEETNNITVLPAKVGAYQALSILSTGEPPRDITNDILVRRAIGYAIDRQAVIDTAFDGRAVESQTLIPAGVLGEYATQVEGFSYDPEQAEALLEEAGWVDGDGDGVREKEGRRLTLEMVSGYPTANDNGQTPEVLQAQLLQVGIETNITAINDSAAYDDYLTEQKGDLWVEIGNQNSASPCFLPSFLYYGGDENPNNYQLAFAPDFVGFPAFDEAMDGCTGAADTDVAAQNAAQAIHILVDEAHTALPLLGLYRIWATSNQVTGFEPHPIFVMVRWNTVSLAP